MDSNYTGGLMLDHRAPVVSRKEFLVNNELLSDVVFLVGKAKQRLYGHKQLLVAASDYFYIMFVGEFKEAKADEIPLEDIEWPIMEEILRHMYCGKINLTMENVHEIFIHSKKFMLWELLQEVSNFLVENVTPETALEMLTRNQFYEFPTVGDKSLELIRDNPLHYFGMDDFVRIDAKSLQDIMKSTHLNCTNVQMFEALKAWHEANPSEKVDELKACIVRHFNDYHCVTLRVYGERSTSSIPKLNISFSTVYGHKSASLYGIRVLAKSKGIVHIHIRSTSDGVICNNEYKVDKLEQNGKADCFFQKIELLPDIAYTIELLGDGLNTSVSIKSPSISENGVPFSLSSSGYNQILSHITDFFCNFTPFVSKKRRFEDVDLN